MWIALLICLICFLASIIGAICGIGGGIIIKPVLDAFASSVLSVKQASFLSGCTVLAMSTYNTSAMIIKKEKGLQLKTAVPLGVGAAIGGVFGKWVFQLIAGGNSIAGLVQNSVLAGLTLMILIYTFLENKIKTYHVQNLAVFVIIGVVLGIFSSFLGIGGGPINLVVLSFFFSMDTKTSAKNSLCIIMISQIASLIYSLASQTVPEFEWYYLLLMAGGGILGGVLGRIIDKRISEHTVQILFKILNVVIVLICVYNVIRQIIAL